MHLLGSLAFLGLIVLLLLAYYMVPLLLFRSGRWLLARMRAGEDRWKGCFTWPLSKKEMRTFGFVLLALALFNGSFYLRQRSEWMGDDNAHLTAKNYYVAGQVLYLYRSIATDVLHPDNFILGPMNALQKWIYSTGVQYLPEEDGEAGVWMHTWFVYPYSKRFRLPKGYVDYVNNGKVAPMLVEHLERVWFSIEQLATKPLADKQMHLQHYLQDFAGMVHYYGYWEGYLEGPITGSGFKLAKMPKHIQRTEEMIDWLQALQERWAESPRIQPFLRDHPEVRVMRQVALMMECSDLIRARINAHRFDCNDPVWSIYQKVRQEFTGNGKEPAPVQQMADREKARKFKAVMMDSVKAKFDWYVLDRYCGMTLPGDVDWSIQIRLAGGKGPALEKYLVRKWNNLYANEMKILEGQFNDHQ